MIKNQRDMLFIFFTRAFTCVTVCELNHVSLVSFKTLGRLITKNGTFGQAF